MYCFFEFIIGVLSILTTILIGWQIYGMVNFNQEKKNLKKEILDFENTIKNRLQKIAYSEKLLEKLGQNEAISLISELSEIKEIEILLKKKYQGKRKVIYMTDQYPTISDPYYYISVYEDTETHITIINRYKVNIETNEILKFNFEKDEYNELKYGKEN